MRMRHKAIGLLAVVGVLNMGVSADAETMSRNRVRLCEAWQFNLGDVPGAEVPSFNDSAWRTLDLPHDWSIELPFDGNVPDGYSVGYLPGGVGWYRKAFTVPESDRGKKVVIDFDGVYMDSQIWINGHLLGRRPNGYISFRYDLTPHLKYGGEENVIAVRANVEPHGSRWYPGAGIYRRVWLTTMNPIHVAHWGTFVTTPDVSREKATVRLQVTVANEGETAASDLIVKSVIYDADGHAVAEASTAGEVGRASCPSTPRGEDGQDARPTEKRREQVSSLCTVEKQFVVTNPQLWSPDTPDLYRIVSTVKVGGKVVDTYTTPLGIRTVEFTTDRGFFLNGEHVDIKGVCLHHDFGPIGTAFYPRVLERQLEILRDMGCNAIRTAHNPRDPEFYSICDRMGFMVMDEAFDVWKASKLGNDYHIYFEEWHERDLTSMVRRDRNHPCIVIYSIGNEINEQHQNRVEYPTQGGDISRRLVEICKQHDPTRPVTAACNHRDAAEKAGIVEPLVVYGQNYGLTQYPSFSKNKPVIGTENATSFITRGAYSYELALGQGVEVRIQNFKNSRECTGYGKFWGEDRTDGTLVFMRKNPHVAGQFAWTGFDYIGECFPMPWPARNGLFGIIDMVGFPKDSYYAYQSDWTDKPMVHIIPQNWNWPQFRNHPIPVWTYSNCEEIELYLNGRSLGAKRINRDETLHAEWGVRYAAGELKAVGRNGGQPVCTNIVRTAGLPARLELTPDRSMIAADDNDLGFVEVRLVDENGVLCPESDRMVQVDVAGDGVLFGVGNGNTFNHEPFKGNRVRTFYGLCRVIVKSTHKDGDIKVTVSGEGIDPVQTEIKTLPADDPRLQRLRTEATERVRAECKRYSRHRIAAVRRIGKVSTDASASASGCQPEHPPEHALDGNPETRWCAPSGKTGHFWQVDLGRPQDVRSMRIRWQTTSAYQYKVEGSADGTGWVTLSDQTRRNTVDAEHELSLNKDNIRYVRIVVTGLPQGLWASLFEVEVYGIIADDADTLHLSQGTVGTASTAIGTMNVAPVFKHGPGQHTDSVIVSRNKKPPMWSEADACRVIVDEARKHGLELTVDGEKPRVDGILATRDGRATSHPVGSPVTMTFDGISKDGRIVFEVLTADDVPAKTDNTDSISDFFGAAEQLVEELQGKPGGLVVGVFYDPLLAKGATPDDEPLRMQVRDFVEWLQR